MGQRQQVLADADQLCARMANLPNQPKADETVNLFNVYAVILGTGSSAARSLGRWEQALTLTGEQLASLQRREATCYELLTRSCESVLAP